MPISAPARVKKVLYPQAAGVQVSATEIPYTGVDGAVAFTPSGPERVMAGTDCGFGTWAGFGAIDPDICWAKMQSLSEGARIAGERAARSHP